MATAVRFLRPPEILLKKRKILLVFLIAVAALASWVYLKRNQPPTVTFAKASPFPAPASMTEHLYAA